MYKVRLNRAICLFTEERNKTPKDKGNYPYKYQLRHGEDWSKPVTIEKSVIVNYYGTVFSPTPLLRDGEQYKEVKTFRILKRI